MKFLSRDRWLDDQIAFWFEFGSDDRSLLLSVCAFTYTEVVQALVCVFTNHKHYACCIGREKVCGSYMHTISLRDGTRAHLLLLLLFFSIGCAKKESRKKCWETLDSYQDKYVTQTNKKVKIAAI